MPGILSSLSDFKQENLWVLAGPSDVLFRHEVCSIYMNFHFGFLETTFWHILNVYSFPVHTLFSKCSSMYKHLAKHLKISYVHQEMQTFNEFERVLT